MFLCSFLGFMKGIVKLIKSSFLIVRMFQSVNKKSPILLSVRARLNKKFWADVAKWIPCRPGCLPWQDSTRPWWVIMVTALWHSTTSDHNWSQYQNLSTQINDKVFNSLSLISPCRNLLPRSLSLPATTNAQFLGPDGWPVSTNESREEAGDWPIRSQKTVGSSSPI